MPITAESLNDSIQEASLDEYELEILSKFLLFVLKRTEKGKFTANRIESGGVIEIETTHYHGRRRFTEKKK